MSKSSEAAPLRVVLLHPPSTGGVRSLFTFHRNKGLGHKPPLAILSLATCLIKAGFRSTVCVDAQAEGLTPEQTALRIRDLRPDVVGLTVWTDFWHPAWRTAELIRRELPQCVIVMGGPHCLIYPSETLKHSAADIVVAGEGEDALVEIARRLQAGQTLPELPGVWSRADGVLRAPVAPNAVVRSLDALPAPDRSLLPVERYSSVLHGGDYETTMVTSRGCPHRCVFCKMHAQRVAMRSAERVVDEFKTIAALGVRKVQVYDDTFTWSKERVMAICQGLLDAGVRIEWAIRDRVNKADEEMYRMLRRAGCVRIHFGVESGAEAVLAASGKGITLNQAMNAVTMAKEAGMVTMSYFMFGFLDETRQDALQTIAFAERLDADYAVFAVLIPYPGTKLYSDALERGLIPRDFWREFAEKPTEDFEIPGLIEQHMTRDTLILLKDRALRNYYFRPRRLIREICRSGSWEDIRDKAGMAWNIISDSMGSVFRKSGGSSGAHTARLEAPK